LSNKLFFKTEQIKTERLDITMAHMWDRGVLNASSWHGLEEVGVFGNAQSMIDHGERTGAYPIALTDSDLFTAHGVRAEGFHAQVASYLSAEHPDRVVGINRERYRATTPEEWRDLLRAAVDAGGKPTGTFSLRDGTRVIATFEIGSDDEQGIKTNLLMADSYDGTSHLTVGFTGVRCVCANTVSVALREDGSGMAKLRHTASLEERVKILQASIAAAIKEGNAVNALFKKACDTVLMRTEARAAFDLLFPLALPVDGKEPTKNAVTRAENEREEAIKAALHPVNRVGDERGNMGTLWNAATFLVDRTADGKARPVKGGGSSLDSMLFGTRGKRVASVQALVDTFLNDTLPTMRERAEADADYILPATMAAR
jgi:hypothetical protein